MIDEVKIVEVLTGTGVTGIAVGLVFLIYKGIQLMNRMMERLSVEQEAHNAEYRLLLGVNAGLSENIAASTRAMGAFVEQLTSTQDLITRSAGKISNDLLTHTQTITRLFEDRASVMAGITAQRTQTEKIMRQEHEALTRTMETQHSAIMDALQTIMPALERIEAKQEKLDSIAREVTARSTPETLRYEMVRILSLAGDLTRDVKGIVKSLADAREPDAPRPSTDDHLAEAEKIQARQQAQPAAGEKPEGAEKEQGE